MSENNLPRDMGQLWITACWLSEYMYLRGVTIIRIVFDTIEALDNKT